MALACELSCDGSDLNSAPRARDLIRVAISSKQDAQPISGIGVAAACVGGVVGGLRVLPVA